MVTKWFIGVSAASKGYFTGFGRYRWSSDGAKPSFTKQTALTTNYDSEKDALEGIDTYRKREKKDYDSKNSRLMSIKKAQQDWDQKTPKEKFDIVNSLGNIFIPYEETRTHSFFGSYRYNINPRFTKYNELNDAQIKAIEDFTLDDEVRKLEEELQIISARLEFINKKLIVREVEIELKFKDTERRQMKWDIRGNKDTAHSYCMGCGGAIPSIPQLRIFGVGNICAICMVKLAEEAKIQAGKIDPEIMEHYQTDRFLRSM